jgi:hypothetical protein
MHEWQVNFIPRNTWRGSAKVVSKQLNKAATVFGEYHAFMRVALTLFVNTLAS